MPTLYIYLLKNTLTPGQKYLENGAKMAGYEIQLEH